MKTNLLLKTKGFWTVVLISLVFIFTTGCEDPTSPNIFSLEDDVRLGSQLDSVIRSSPAEYTILHSEEATGYVQNIADEIIQSPNVEYSDVFEYDVTIIRDDSTINAFAAPGGFIYVYTGLMKFLDNEATLAAVLAHEIAHCESRHATERMTKQYGISLLADVILGNDPEALEQIATNLLTNLALLKNSRDDEYEADEKSFKYLKSINTWYPGAMTFFFDKIEENSGGGFLEELLSTHPMPDDRVAAVEELIENSDIPEPSENNLFTQRYQEFLQTLP